MLVDNRSVSGLAGGDPWAVGHLRATAFAPDIDTDAIAENTRWEEIVGSTPKDERINGQKRMKEQKDTLNGGRLSMISESNRIDWTFEAAEKRSTEESKLNTLGPMSDDTLRPFVDIIKNWMRVCPPANRLAFGGFLPQERGFPRRGITRHARV